MSPFSKYHKYYIDTNIHHVAEVFQELLKKKRASTVHCGDFDASLPSEISGVFVLTPRWPHLNVGCASTHGV